MSNRKNGIRIVSTGRALPGTIITNEELSRRVDTSDEWIRSRTGIAQRYQCGKETCLSLAVSAAREAMESGGIDPEEIGVILTASSSRDYIFPSASCLVQRELGISEEVTAFDLSAACTGFMLALQTARGLLQNGKKPYALIIGSEELSRILDYSDRSSCILFGDGAGAVIVELSEQPYIQKSWSRGNVDALNCPGAGRGEQKLSMDGRAVFRFAVAAMEQAITEVLQEAGRELEEVDLILCHQANERIIRHVQKKYRGQEEKFYLNIDRYANTSAASIPIALDELNREGRLKEGMKLVLAGFGAGLTWSGAYLEL
ncbi:MAG: beta-ketoacyl-ACP synthase III [Lachnospiraceae bacterium]|nr:beta-ketoacyl-ACP synthase III [Lachnospiraceae bacterium]